ncbi:hypothetical protein BBOU_0944 [Bifidobacterium boum]|uniref:Uncharacterized protein n=1 Tax=Bifidobacterium boum TaxID=78343 RepID=A0A086ZLJ6_9BIFI|nr:hypothetical protein BBOU_0944 [Bifidobacterium boum]
MRLSAGAADNPASILPMADFRCVFRDAPDLPPTAKPRASAYARALLY